MCVAVVCCRLHISSEVAYQPGRGPHPHLLRCPERHRPAQGSPHTPGDLPKKTHPQVPGENTEAINDTSVWLLRDVMFDDETITQRPSTTHLYGSCRDIMFDNETITQHIIVIYLYRVNTCVAGLETFLVNRSDLSSKFCIGSIT